jgi:uncharacterized protein
MSVSIREVRQVNLKDGVVIDGFPTTGLANAIAAECIIETLGLDLVAVIDSDKFPSLSTIYEGRPYFPARVHANEELKLAVFISELTLRDPLLRPIARSMLDWAQKHGCSLVLSAAGLPAEAGEKLDGIEVLGVGSTRNATDRIEKAGMRLLEHGAVTGIPAILLSEGRLVNVDVIAFLVRVLKDYPDFRAAATVSQAFGLFAPSCQCDITSLLTEAEKVEKRMRKIQRESAMGGETIYG